MAIRNVCPPLRHVQMRRAEGGEPRQREAVHLEVHRLSFLREGEAPSVERRAVVSRLRPKPQRGLGKMSESYICSGEAVGCWKLSDFRRSRFGP